MIKKLLGASRGYLETIIAVFTICTTIFSYAALRVNKVKKKAVEEYVREQTEIRKDTTLVFLSRGFVQVNNRLDNIEGMIKMQNDVANEHTMELKSVKGSLTKHYLRDESLTKKDLIEALQELDAKKKENEASATKYEPRISITPIVRK